MDTLTTEERQINGNELVCSSFLLKRLTLQWKKLWFVLRKNSQLAIYKDEEEYKPLSIMNLKDDDITVSRIVKKDNEKDRFQFALFSPKNKTIHLKALNEYDFNNWFLNLQRMSSNDIYINEERKDDKKEDRKEREKIKDKEKEKEEEHDYENDDDYFTSDNEQPTNLHKFYPEEPILEENEHQILQAEQNLVEEQSSQNKMELERIQNSAPADFMKDYVIQRYLYKSPQHVIQKGYLMRLKNLNQWKKFFIVLTNRNLLFYKIHNYGETINIDYETLIQELDNPDWKDSKKVKVFPTKIIDLKNLVDVVELDPLSKSKKNCLLIITPTKRYRFCTKTGMELVNWLILFKSFLIVRKKELESERETKP